MSKEGVECEVCERWFHIKCAGVAAGHIRRYKWTSLFTGTAKDAVEEWRVLRRIYRKDRKSWKKI
jgi:hypothetical protein